MHSSENHIGVLTDRSKKETSFDDALANKEMRDNLLMIRLALYAMEFELMFHWQQYNRNCKPEEKLPWELNGKRNE